MNEYDLYDAFGGIDDDLLERSEARQVGKPPLRKALIAAAAVMLLAVTAMAAPLIQALLFPTEVVQVTEGGRHIYGDLYLDIDNDGYRIDLMVEDASALPTTIEEVRLPLYMIENNWLVSYGEIDAIYSDAPVHFKWWDRESPKWVTFGQKCISQDGAFPGEGCFELETYHGAEMTRETMYVCGVEIVYYSIPAYWNQETWEFYPEVTAVYWSDGEYAYELQCAQDVPQEELASIVLSVQTVEDVTPYLKNDPNNDGMVLELPPLDHHRMPTAIPEGYVLKVCADNEWHVDWIWEHGEGHTIRFTEAHSQIYTELFSIAYSMQDREHVEEEIERNGLTVHFLQCGERAYLVWDEGSCCNSDQVANSYGPNSYGHVYVLEWDGCGVTREDMLALMDSVVEVEDISKYKTQ